MTFPTHPLTNFEIQEYYQNEPRFNGVFSRDNLPNIIKNGAYVINLDEYHDIGTHWVALYMQSTSVDDTYVNSKIVTYFDSFGVEHTPKEIMKFINRKEIITNIYRIQSYDSRILYTFVPNKTFGSLLEISPTNQVFLKTFNSEFQEVKIWFTDQTSKPLELEDKINITLIIKQLNN